MKPRPCPGKPPETKLLRKSLAKVIHIVRLIDRYLDKKSCHLELDVKKWWHFSNNCIANRKI